MDKREALRHLIALEDVKNALIFCNRKRDVDILYRSLTKHGFDAVQLHGDMAQSARTETLEQFRKSEVRLLVCSDVAARGIDISGLSHVFNFDVPHHPELYVHRIGRTGRAGKEGRAFTIATSEDGKFLAAIVRLIGREIPRMTLEGVVSESSHADGAKAESHGSSSRERGGARRSRPEPRKRNGAHREEAEAAPATDVAVAAAVEAQTPEPEVPAAPVRDLVPVVPVAPIAKPAREPAPIVERVREPVLARSSGAVGFGDHLPDFIARSSASAGRRRVG